MKPIQHPLATTILGKPKDWDEEKRGPCNGLPVHIDHSDPAFYSYWGTTWRERLLILLGRPVRLCVASSAHPPVHLDTEKN